MFHVFGARAQFERELIQERTKAGLAAARARGRMGGRPRKLGAKEVATARRLLEDPEQAVKGVAELLGVGRSTLYRALERHAQAEAKDASLRGWARPCGAYAEARPARRSACTARWRPGGRAGRCAAARWCIT